MMRGHYDFSKGRRGEILKVPSGKTRITIRLDDDVLAWFRQRVHEAGGGNYQTLINDALRRFIEDKSEHLESVLRTVVREELARYGDSSSGTRKGSNNSLQPPAGRREGTVVSAGSRRPARRN